MSKKRKKTGKRSKKSPKNRENPHVGQNVNSESNAAEVLASTPEKRVESKESASVSSPSFSFADDYVFSPIAPTRVSFLLRSFLLLLAFDGLIEMVGHGGRYGVLDFNVAHFSFLDAMLGVPSAGFYVGTLIFTAFAACVTAIVPTRIGVVAVFVGYTLAWSMSMIDSYQHHYLLSLILAGCALFYDQAGFSEGNREASSKEKQADVPEEKVAICRTKIAAGALLLLGLNELVAAFSNAPSIVDYLSGDSFTSSVVSVIAFVSAIFLLRAHDSQVENQLGKRLKKTNKVQSSVLYQSITCTAAIVYFFALLAKIEPGWRDGRVLSRQDSSGGLQGIYVDHFQNGFLFLGPMDLPSFWQLMAHATIAVELALFLTYALAPWAVSVLDMEANRDNSKNSRANSKQLFLARIIALVGFFSAVSFHLGVEIMGPAIGWFSFYMVILPVAIFAPLRVIVAIVAFADAAFGRVLSLLSSANTWLALASAALSFAAFFVLGLPGAIGALVISVLTIAVIMTLKPALLSRLAVAALVANVCVFLALTETAVRFDYYRFVGGDYRRRGEHALALEAYELANQYLVTPYCVTAGRKRIDCYRTEERANVIAERYDDASVRRVDRQEAEDRMRAIVEAEQSGAEK